MAGTALTVSCHDGYVLRGHLWEPAPTTVRGSPGVVVIAAATGVKASYYRRYAAFLAENGFTAITFDYRGIGESRGATIRNVQARWYDWGLKDLDAVLGWALRNGGGGDLNVVGHSFGGFAAGMAGNGRQVKRLLAVGAQHAHWRDYQRGHRLRYWWRWHTVMPLLTWGHGYFPGKRLGWLEDLPKGVATDWARSPSDFNARLPATIAEEIRANQAAFTADTLAVAATDDPFATEAAVARGLSYYPNSNATLVRLKPEDFGLNEIGHFAPFHSHFRDTFWAGTVRGLRDGVNPWD
jgi:predicted alpha/beta hydrolase